MDRRGRLAQPIKRPAGAGTSARGHQSSGSVGRRAKGAGRLAASWRAELGLYVERIVAVAQRWRPRRAGILASILLIFASAGYGAVKGDHVPAIVEGFKHARDATANAAGFRIATLAITGRRQLSEAEILAAAGIGPQTSLLFLDVEAARQRLEATPWVAQATVRKLYPGHLDIAVVERDAFAYWQTNGKVSVIAADGTVLGPVGERPIAQLPLVVGPGAAGRAREFLALLDQYPAIRSELRAAVLVAERRWNLKLKSGLDIRLPESGVSDALETLMGLDQEKKILSRDLTAVDLRLPGRITVRLADETAQAREKEREKKKKKGGDA